MVMWLATCTPSADKGSFVMLSGLIADLGFKSRIHNIEEVIEDIQCLHCSMYLRGRYVTSTVIQCVAQFSSQCTYGWMLGRSSTSEPGCRKSHTQLRILGDHVSCLESMSATSRAHDLIQKVAQWFTCSLGLEARSSCSTGPSRFKTAPGRVVPTELDLAGTKLARQQHGDLMHWDLF